jgi:uncharacterized protein YbbC (DUF1343 family)
MKRSGRIGFFHMLHRPFDQFLEHIDVYVFDLFDVQAGLAGGMFAQLPQQLVIVIEASHDI